MKDVCENSLSIKALHKCNFLLVRKVNLFMKDTKRVTLSNNYKSLVYNRQFCLRSKCSYNKRWDISEVELKEV